MGLKWRNNSNSNTRSTYLLHVVAGGLEGVGQDGVEVPGGGDAAAVAVVTAAALNLLLVTAVVVLNKGRNCCCCCCCCSCCLSSYTCWLYLLPFLAIVHSSYLLFLLLFLLLLAFCSCLTPGWPPVPCPRPWTSYGGPRDRAVK